MAFAPDTFNPTVVGGSVVTDSINHTLASGQSFKEGELVRLTSAGTVKVAALDTDTAGAVHGIALGNAADYADLVTAVKRRPAAASSAHGGLA